MHASQPALASAPEEHAVPDVVFSSPAAHALRDLAASLALWGVADDRLERAAVRWLLPFIDDAPSADLVAVGVPAALAPCLTAFAEAAMRMMEYFELEAVPLAPRRESPRELPAQ